MKTLPAALVLLALPLGACRYDGPNPWDTSDDVEDLDEKTEQDLELALAAVWEEPQTAHDPLLDPDMDAWRRTVLPNADLLTLRRAEEQSRTKVTLLEQRIRGLMRTDEHGRKVVLTTTVLQWRSEKVRLQLIQDRLKAMAG